MRASLVVLTAAVLVAVTVALDLAARAGRLDSEYWLLVFWALGLCWIVALVYGFVWLFRRIGLARGIAALAAATAVMQILFDNSTAWGYGWPAVLLGWVVAVVYGLLWLLARGWRHFAGRSELVR